MSDMNSWKGIIRLKYHLAIFSIIKLLRLIAMHSTDYTIFCNGARDKIKINPKAIIIGNPNTFVIA